MRKAKGATAVLDASALLAFLFAERGGEAVPALAGRAPAMSAVNWSEVCQKALAHDVPPEALLDRALDVGLMIMDLTRDRAERVASLWIHTYPLGLSLADRACLALAIELASPAVTADRSWRGLAIAGLAIRPVR